MSRLSGTLIPSDRGKARRIIAPMVNRPRVRPTLRAPSDDPAFATFVALVEDAPVAAFIKDPDGRYFYANAYLLATVFERIGSNWLGKTDVDIWPAKIAALVRRNDRSSLERATLPVFRQVMPVGSEVHTFLVTKIPLIADDGTAYLGGIAFDQTEQRSVATQRDLLATVVEQANDAVMIADLDGQITYVNAAFERVSGYQRNEVIGQNPRILKSGIQPATFYQAMWHALGTGSPYVADFVNRRKDGSLFTEEAVISPIHDASGALTNYVAVKRDVSREREIEQRTTRLARERAAITETLGALNPGNTPEATAQAVVHQVLNLSGVAAAQLFIFEFDSRAVPIGFSIAGQPDPPLHRLPSIPSHELRMRGAQGPWIQSWVARPADAYYDELKGLGPHLVAAAPMRSDDELIGLLVIDATEDRDEIQVSEVASRPGRIRQPGCRADRS